MGDRQRLVPEDVVRGEVPVPDRVVGGPRREAVALLGLAQGLLGMPAFRDVARRADEAHGAAVSREGLPLGGHPALDAVLQSEGPVHDVVAAASGRIERGHDRPVDPGAVVRVQARQEHLVADGRLRPQAEQGAGPRVPFQSVGDEVVVEDAGPGRLDGQGQLLPRLAQVLFGLTPVVDLAVAAEPADHHAARIPARFGPDQEPAIGSVMAPQARLGVVDDRAAAGRVPGPKQAVEVVRMDRLAPAERQRLFRRLAGIGVPAVVQVAEAAVRIAEPDDRRGEFGERLEALLGGLALVDVEGGADPASEVARLVAHGPRPRQEPAILSVGPAERELDLVRALAPRRREPRVADALAVTGVDHPHPARLAGLAGGQPRVIVPIGIAVGDVAGLVAEPHHLRADLDQGAVAHLAVAQRGFRGALRGAVAQDLEVADERAALGGQRHHLARGPEAGSVPADVPALVRGAAVLPRQAHLDLRAALRAILRREERVDRLPEHLGLGPAEDALGARVPA